VSHPSDLPTKRDGAGFARSLELAAEKGGWGKPLPKARGRGMAAYASFGSYFAEVAEVTVKGSEFKIGRIVAAVDCGQIVNPESVCSQTEGAIIFWVERRAEP
jgi:isoquinoline 1-oxidoreductase beta subunit